MADSGGMQQETICSSAEVDKSATGPEGSHAWVAKPYCLSTQGDDTIHETFKSSGIGVAVGASRSEFVATFTVVEDGEPLVGI
jgi:hypothetical protein